MKKQRQQITGDKLTADAMVPTTLKHSFFKKKINAKVIHVPRVLEGMRSHQSTDSCGDGRLTTLCAITGKPAPQWRWLQPPLNALADHR